MIAPLTPRELKIEITDACDLQCTYCYHGDACRQGTRFMPEEDVLRWIDWAEDNDVPGVRFTGGEATLHPQIAMFCNYAQLLSRRVILNTNGTGKDELYRKLFRVVAALHISLPTLDAGHMDRLTGSRDVLAKKQSVIRLALEAGVPKIFLLTPLLPELHGTLEKFAQFVQTSDRFLWTPLRFGATPLVPRPWTRADAQAFAEEIADLMDRYPKQVQGVFPATPFCSITPASLGARVFHGRVQNCGPFAALNVNVRGHLSACYGIGEMQGVHTLTEIRNAPEIRDCASIKALPDECRQCPHLVRCGGGCRKPCGLVQHGNKWIDHLAGFVPAELPEFFIF